ncbi:MAG TPA: adenosyl-hopene transferase HpnH [Blastocatellia bacterium]|jgi:hopanoid biosynthesis associated radical SAM protein HpnH|nr:adenosyl-hopene transferase HpnH [Blastocatellia bacterium]
MRFPLHLTTDAIRHQASNALKGNKRYPMVLMLEPLYTCNLACLGCALERHTGRLEDRVPLAKCLSALDDCGAPIVSICGGEPTIYPELKELIEGVIERKRHVYLCTNALLLETKLFGQVAPHKRLTINVHLDGMQKTHDLVCDRAGVFDTAINMIKMAKRLGYHVTTNTTVFKETDMNEVEEVCRLVSELGVDGLMIAPGYHYESVEHDIFLTRQEINNKFKRVLDLSKRYRLMSTPMYLEFTAGMREYDCSPWSTVTYTPSGWKGPCYLIGKQWFDTWDEFWNGVDWTYWESRRDSLCQNCLMHSGFEASAMFELRKSPRDMLRMAMWNLMG